MEGQLWDIERVFLHEAVLEAKPRLVLEVGTWKGGGSTLQIAMALKKLKSGHLITCEPDNDLYAEASAIYNTEEWSGIVHCYNCKSVEIIYDLIQTRDFPDFLFFDGPENPEAAYNDFRQLEPHLPVGSYFSMHDFVTTRRADGLVSTKAALIRPYLESRRNWELLRMLGDPVSVGICLFRKL